MGVIDELIFTLEGQRSTSPNAKYYMFSGKQISAEPSLLSTPETLGDWTDGRISWRHSAFPPRVVVIVRCCSLEYTFRTIYWAVFGLKDSRTVELGGYQSRFTESLGYIVFGVYNWGAVIVLLNMLIAMMTRSFDKIAVSRLNAVTSNG